MEQIVPKHDRFLFVAVGLTFFVLASILFVPVTHADVFQGAASSTQTLKAVGTGETFYMRQGIGTALTGSISSVTFKYQAPNTSAACFLNDIERHNNADGSGGEVDYFPTSVESANGASYTITDTDKICLTEPNTNADLVTIHYSTITPDSSKYYFFVLNSFTDTAVKTFYGSATSTGRSHITAYYEVGGVDYTATTTINDLYLSIPEVTGGYWPTVSAAQQFRSDATTTIAAGAITTDNTIAFGGTLAGGTSTLQLQIEVEAAGSNNFTGTPNATSTFVSQGGYATATYSLSPELSANGNYHWQARVVDANGSSSTWKAFGPSATSTDFVMQTVPLFTQIGSPYPSAASTSAALGGWAGDTYDDGTIYCGDGNTIGYCGCAITSVAMALRYFGVATDTLGDPVDPRTLNTWLTNNGGYTSEGVLDWTSIVRYASSSNGGVITLDPNSGQGYGSTLSAMRPYLDPLLASSTPVPVILTENANSHFVAALGLAQNNGTSTYAVRDSAWYFTQYLNQATSTETSSTIYGYGNNADGVHIYYDPPTIPRTNTYAVNLPNSLMLIDARGRRTGKDPATGAFYHEIPDTMYSEDSVSPGHGSAQLTLFTPENGRYMLYILGNQGGQYHLDSWIDDGGPKSPVPQRISGNVGKGSMVAHEQNYDLAHIVSSTLSFKEILPSTGSITVTPPHNLPRPVPPRMPSIPSSHASASVPGPMSVPVPLVSTSTATTTPNQ